MQIISPKKYVFLVLGCGALLAGCNRFYQANSVAYQQVAIQQQNSKDTAIENMLKPYADKVNQQMSKVIGEVAVPLEKKLPESSLGNLMADAISAEAEKLYGKKIDAAFINYGGIRTNQVPAGALTLNAVFEMMPFDNQLVVQELPGNILQQFLDTVATRGGWPSAGVQYVISNKKASLVKIGGEPLDPAKIYTVANSDYVVNGGDNCTMLKAYPQDNKGFLVRDALIRYFTAFTARGEKIFAQVENRVTYAH
jgi:2',3'-cyclic-nucleotide 2'-phosphodiesterase (5'-nucleotidase family)